MLDGFTPVPPEFARRYRDKGYWLDKPLGLYFKERFARHPTRVAIVAGDERITYRDLDRRIDRLARHLLGLGIGPLQCIVLQLPTCPEFVYAYFACQRVGAITLMALPAHRKHEIGHYAPFTGAVGYAAPVAERGFSFVDMARDIQRTAPGLRHLLIRDADAPAGCHSLARMLATEPELPASALDEVEIDPDAPAVFQLSGGTTGIPKIIPRTHNDYVLNSIGCAGANHMDAETRLLVCLPIAHNFPLASPGIQGAFLHGGRAVLSPGARAADILDLIEGERITHLELAPAILIRLLGEDAFDDRDVSSVRIVNTGGQRLQPETAALAEAKFPNAAVQEVFGMAEGLVMLNDIADPPATRFETVGPVWCEDDEIKLLDDDGREVPAGETGEMACRGPYTLRGYYRLPERNAESFTPDGFFLTGDLMRLHSPGRYVVEGRKKDLINRGGEKISAEEIENLLLAHPSVRNAACVPMPDPVLGERTCAYVVPTPGAAPTLGELADYLTAAGLARFKLPERLELVDRFPLSPFGKVSKKDLAASIAAAVAAERDPNRP